MRMCPGNSLNVFSIQQHDHVNILTMSVKIRKKPLANGLYSLYLDYYPPIKGPDGRLTRREFLKRYCYMSPKTEAERRVNQENMLFAEGMRITREREILNEQDGLFNAVKKKADFILFFEFLVNERKSSINNFGNWKSACRHFKEFSHGQCKMGDINEVLCNQFKDYLIQARQVNLAEQRKLSHNSAVSYFNKFLCAVNEAYKRRLLPVDYSQGIQRIRPRESKREFLTLEELQKLSKTETDIGVLREAALFSALTGLRWSDIVSLKWKDIQRTENTCFIHIVQQKTGEVIMHPIGVSASALIGEPKERESVVFAGLHYSDRNNRKLKDWLRSAGIEKKIGFHNFRHTYATLMLNNGTDIFTVSKMLGHKNIQTTMIYSKILTESKVKAANAIQIEL